MLLKVLDKKGIADLQKTETGVNGAKKSTQAKSKSKN
jgi:hypothetical protein